MCDYLKISNSRTKKALFIENCFRDIADCDYISARTNYRLELLDQFSWSSLQACEKYLKAILLYFDKDTRKINHNLIEAINRVETIREIKWDFLERHREYLEYLSQNWADRYFEFPKSSIVMALQKLDDFVWHVRRYCQDIPYLRNESDWSEYYDYLQSNKTYKKANKFILKQPGYLEEVLRNNRFILQRQNLIWKNLFYGANKKHKFRFNDKVKSGVPAHFFFTDIFPWVLEHVRISKTTIEYYEENKESLDERASLYTMKGKSI